MTRARAYWDACCWIAYIQKEMPGPGSTFTEPRYDMCRQTIQRAEAGEIEIATSAFTLAEVCKKPPDPGSPAANLAAFFDQPYILLVPVDKQVGVQAQSLQLAGLQGVKPPDAVHLASAIVWSIPVLHTFDDDLLKLDKLLTLADGNQLRILRPTEEQPIPDLLKAMQSGPTENPEWPPATSIATRMRRAGMSGCGRWQSRGQRRGSRSDLGRGIAGGRSVQFGVLGKCHRRLDKPSANPSFKRHGRAAHRSGEKPLVHRCLPPDRLSCSRYRY